MSAGMEKENISSASRRSINGAMAAHGTKKSDEDKPNLAKTAVPASGAKKGESMASPATAGQKDKTQGICGTTNNKSTYNSSSGTTTTTTAAAAAAAQTKKIKKAKAPTTTTAANQKGSKSKVTPKARAKSKSKDNKQGTKTQTNLREYFTVRTSGRRTEATQKREAESVVHDMLRKGLDMPDLKVVDVPGKGKGVVGTKLFRRGDYVCEYAGDLITGKEAEEREKKYKAADENKTFIHCYMYFLKHDGKQYCVDATVSGRIGRLINHSRRMPNLETKLFVVDDVPHLALVATTDIAPGVELAYDYGERDKETIEAHPWLLN
eukprot:UC1_evm1s200